VGELEDFIADRREGKTLVGPVRPFLGSLPDRVILRDTQSARERSSCTSSRAISEAFEITAMGIPGAFKAAISSPRCASRVGSSSGTKVR